MTPTTPAGQEEEEEMESLSGTSNRQSTLGTDFFYFNAFKGRGGSERHSTLLFYTDTLAIIYDVSLGFLTVPSGARTFKARTGPILISKLVPLIRSFICTFDHILGRFEQMTVIIRDPVK